MRYKKELFVCIFFTLTFFALTKTASAETLSCTIRTSSCSGGEVEIFEMQNTANSHAGLSAASYNNLVCCTGITGLGNSCSGMYAEVLRLSGASNAHARQGTHASGDYSGSDNACISVPSNKTISIGYQASSCSGYDATLGSMSGATNAHVGDTDAYTTKICATVGNNTAPTLSVAQPDGTDDSVMTGDSYNITYTLSDPDNLVTAAFYYDTNGSGLDGTAITGDCATAPEGTGVTCSWDTAGVPAGSYYIYGITDDGVNPQVSAYSPGMITINAATGQLICAIRTSACDAGEVEIFEMQNTTNSHAGLPAASYNNLVCCGGITGLSNSCNGTYAKVLRLSGATNAHARQGTHASRDYAGANNACISVPSGGAILLGYQASSCSGYDTTLGSMSGTTNAHIGNDNAYTTKICASAAPAGLSTAIEIRAQNYTSSVSSITFPEGAPETTVSQPYNNIDGSGSPQTFGSAGNAKPVITLYNSGASTLKIWYNITAFTNSIVSSENYLVNNKGAACTDASCISNAVIFDTDTDSGITITGGAGNEKDFYLKIILSAIAGKTGNSTLTILGETQ